MASRAEAGPAVQAQAALDPEVALPVQQVQRQFINYPVALKG